jgi:L-galactono-1,4-lactone dehydrogenase
MAMRLLRMRAAAAGAAAGGLLMATRLSLAQSSVNELGGTRGEVISNWSATHEASPELYFEPDSQAAVERILHWMHEAGRHVRVVGSALSPNGLGLSNGAMLNMAQCDAIISVDTESKQVTVRAGARVKEVVEALRPHGLTLQNYASIAEQQIGGFIQVGAHGTGASIPPVDEQVVRMTLISPALGPIELSAETEPRLFRLARVGLGALGVVSEVTLQCVDAHRLIQHTFTTTRASAAANHASHLAHQHMRYMWIPYTDTVVVVTCDPVPPGDLAEPLPPPIDELHATEPLRELLLRNAPHIQADEARAMNFAQLRCARPCLLSGQAKGVGIRGGEGGSGGRRG